MRLVHLILLSNALVVSKAFRAGRTSPVRARQAVCLAAERPDPFAVPRPDPSILVAAKPDDEQKLAFAAIIGAIAAGTGVVVSGLSILEAALPEGWYATWRDYTWAVPLGPSSAAGVAPSPSRRPSSRSPPKGTWGGLGPCPPPAPKRWLSFESMRSDRHRRTPEAALAVRRRPRRATDRQRPRSSSACSSRRRRPPISTCSAAADGRPVTPPIRKATQAEPDRRPRSLARSCVFLSCGGVWRGGCGGDLWMKMQGAGAAAGRGGGAVGNFPRKDADREEGTGGGREEDEEVLVLVPE